MLCALMLALGPVSGLRRQSKAKSSLQRSLHANASPQEVCDVEQCSKLQRFLHEQVENKWECGPTEVIVGHAQVQCCRAHEKLDRGVLGLYSASKIISGYTMLKLVDEGLLSLETKVGDVLDWWNTNAKRKKVTLRHLMSMTSGIVPTDGTVDSADRACQPPQSVGDKTVCSRITRSGVADSEPGEVWRYSQLDPAVFGEMAMQITGLDSWSKVVAKYLFEPLGVNKWRCFWNDALKTPYLVVAGGLRCNIDEIAKVMESVGAKTLFRNQTLFDEAERPHTLGLKKNDPGGKQNCTPDGVAAGCRNDRMPAWFFGGRDGWKDGIYFHYGLTQWVECATPDCNGGILRTSSPGLFGMYPWVDRGGLSGAQPHWGIIFRKSPKSGGFCWPVELELLPISNKIVLAR